MAATTVEAVFYAAQRSVDFAVMGKRMRDGSIIVDWVEYVTGVTHASERAVKDK